MEEIEPSRSQRRHRHPRQSAGACWRSTTTHASELVLARCRIACRAGQAGRFLARANWRCRGLPARVRPGRRLRQPQLPVVPRALPALRLCRPDRGRGLEARGHGHARAALRRPLPARCLRAGHERVVCEVNSRAAQSGSDAFHAALGFTEVGTRHHPCRQQDRQVSGAARARRAPSGDRGSPPAAPPPWSAAAVRRRGGFFLLEDAVHASDHQEQDARR
jgi:hypothetical protein